MEKTNKLGKPSLSLSDTSTITCEVCGEKVFEQSVMLQRVPALLTGTGQDGIVPVPVFVCSKCGHVNQEFIPVELREESKGKLA